MSEKLKNIFPLFLFISVAVPSRKYDIEEEAVRLYGEHVEPVLKRFRRTPEYLKILEDRFQDLKEHYQEVSIQTEFYLKEKLKEECKQMYSNTTISENETPAFRNPNSVADGQFDKVKNYMQGDKKYEEMAQNQSSLEFLEDAYIFHSIFTVEDRKILTDLGFQYARDMIQFVIKSMGLDEISMRSTKQQAWVRGSTYKKAKYENTDESPNDEIFKYKHRASDNYMARQFTSRF